MFTTDQVLALFNISVKKTADDKAPAASTSSKMPPQLRKALEERRAREASKASTAPSIYVQSKPGAPMPKRFPFVVASRPTTFMDREGEIFECSPHSLDAVTLVAPSKRGRATKGGRVTCFVLRDDGQGGVEVKCYKKTRSHLEKLQQAIVVYFDAREASDAAAAEERRRKGTARRA